MSIKTVKPHKISRIDRLYTDEGGFDFIGRTKIWYGITVALLLISIAAIGIRGFNLSIDFEGGTKLSMPAGDLQVERVEETFTEATGVTPELVQIVGSGNSETLEVNSERLSQEQVDKARQAIYEAYQPLNEAGEPSPDAIGSSTVSESWGSAITERMLLAMLVFLAAATVYVAIRLQRNMAIAAILALLADGVIILGIYALFGLEVSPAVIIGLLTVLTFSIYDSVIVFDKVNENTEGIEGQRKHTYGEQANLAINQTVMRSISTTIISALPIIALFVVAVWLMGIGTLRDLALIQLIGVVEGIFSSLFLATPLLVSLANRTKKIKRHNKVVADYREATGVQAGELAPGDEDSASAAITGTPKRRVASPVSTTAPERELPVDAAESSEDTPRNDSGFNGGASWRPGR